MKTKNNQISLLQMFQGFINFKTFNKNISLTNLLIANSILLLVIFVLTIISSTLTYNFQPITESFTLIIIGIPIFLTVIYSIIYLMLAAFDKLQKTYKESFLIYSFLTLGFILVGNTINFIKTISNNNFIISVASILMFITILYYIINITINMKNYFDITWQRMFFSQVFTYILISLSVITYWINILITSLK